MKFGVVSILPPARSAVRSAPNRWQSSRPPKSSVEASRKRDGHARQEGEKEGEGEKRRFFRTWVRAVPRKDVDSYLVG